MKENEFPVLKCSNIDWDKDHEEYEKLPQEIEIRWNFEGILVALKV